MAKVVNEKSLRWLPLLNRNTAIPPIATPNQANALKCSCRKITPTIAAKTASLLASPTPTA